MSHPAAAFSPNLTPTLSQELADAVKRHTLDRRGFLAFSAKGLAVACALPVMGRIGAADAATPPTGKELASAYIHIGTDNRITLIFGGCEMGQGAMTGLAQILAEELGIDWSQVNVETSLADPVVSYLTGGSSAVRGRYDRLRTAGAAARELLVAAAMSLKGDGNRDNYSVKSASVVHTASATTWTYGALSTLASTQAVPADLRLTPPAQFKVIGKPVPRLDIPSKVNGSAKYGLDTWLPNMVFAAIKHCPTIGGTLAVTPALPGGAIAVVPCKQLESRGAVKAGTVNAVAVVASNTWQAFQLAARLNVKWTLPASTVDVDSGQILATAKQLMASGTGVLVADPVAPAGYTPASYAPVMAQQVGALMGTPTLDATYTLPYVAHGTMEVLACTVNITYNSGAIVGCEMWAPTQSASWASGTAAALTGLPATAITVHTTLLGGGLGRKIEQDFIAQAVQVAMAVKKPVKLTWRREEDIAHDQYRPFALVNIKAKLNGSAVTAWSSRNVSQAILGQRGWLPPGAVDSQAVEGSIDLPYELGAHVAEWVPLNAGIPVGFWRSVGSSINAFAVESMIDELALAAKVDPFQFRFNMLMEPRTIAVLAAAEAMSLWRKTLPAGHAWGLAFAHSFGTYVCQVVEISRNGSTGINVHRVACAVDCGTVINPDSVEAQMQGGIVHGLNATLWGQVTFVAGKAQQSNFRNARVMRANEMPTVTVKIVPSTLPPAGVGEPGVPPVAPAIANAYSRLTGTRVRTLPLFPGVTMGGL